MKKLAKVVEVEDEGLVKYLGKKVHIWSLRHNYYGTLVGVNDKFLRLDDAKLVFDTGSFTQSGKEPKFTHAETTYSTTMYVAVGTIESWVVVD